jgi:hypothetical protein
MSEALAPSEGPLSVEQAVESLISAPAEPEAAAPVEETAQPEEIAAEPTAEDPDAEPAEPGEEGEAEAEPAVALEPPKYWAQEAKAKFSELPAELQAVVLAQEGPREEAAAKAKAEAAESVKAAQQEASGVKALAEHLGTFLPQAIETFKSRWGDDPDWAAIAAERGTDEAVSLKFQYEAEQRELLKVQQATQVAQQESHKVFLREQFEALKTVAPELADPVEGPKLRAELGEYLIANGATPEALSQVTAVEMSIARKAMLWDRAQANLKAAPKPIAAPAKAPVKAPAALAPASQQRTATQVANRFAQTRGIDDAVALLLAKG